MHINANGIDIHYRFDGPEDAPVVMLSNSLASNLDMWDPQVEALVGVYRVLRYDTRGHGQTQATPGPYTLELLTDDALALLAALGIERTHFCGLSLGGMIGQVLAASHPTVIRGLVLCDTACTHLDEHRSGFVERFRIAEAEGMGALVQPTLERWFTAPYREAQPAVMGKIGKMVASTSIEGYLGCGHAVQTLDVRHYHEKITAPTLIIVGEDDPSTTVASAELVHQGIPSSELVVLPQAAHLSNLEQANRFNEALLGFLGRV